MESSVNLKGTTPLFHKNVIDLQPGTRVRITAINDFVVEGDILKNPKSTANPDWVEIVNCNYIEPKSLGVKRVLRYQISEMKELTIIRTPTVTTKPKPLVMTTSVVTNELELTSLTNSFMMLEEIGLEFHGDDVGRFTNVAWISMYCKGHLIDIDIESFNANVDKSKIWPILKKELFENSNIVKVVFDVRPIAYYLHHTHSIELVNVFDIRIAELKVASAVEKTELDELLFKYLSHLVIKEEIEDYAKFRTDNDRFKKFFARPFQIDHTAKGIALSVKYLMELKKVLNKKMLGPFFSCVDNQMFSIIDGDTIDMINLLGKPVLISKETVDHVTNCLKTKSSTE